MRYTCANCGKWVKDKFIFGTLHICLLPEERAYKAHIDGDVKWLAQAQREDIMRAKHKLNINYSKLKALD